MTALTYLRPASTPESADKCSRRNVAEQTATELHLTAGPAVTAFAKGLCAQCNLASTCTFPRNENRPIVACEEFDGEGKPQKLRLVGALLSSVDARSGAETSSGANVRHERGLCSTCEKRESCTFPRQDGGVWQCDEFE